jgi:glucose-1-phosphatase
MPLRAIVWDLGGVLLRTEDRTPRQQAAALLGLSYEQLENLVFNSDVGTRAQLGEINPDELWRHVLDVLGLPAEDRPWLEKAFFGGDRMDDGLVNYVRALRPRYKTGLISNAWNDLRSLLYRWNIADAFDTVLVSGEVNIMKPDPRIYLLALEKLDVQAAEAVFIDDNLKNVEGACAVGMAGIRFVHREQVLDELARLMKD